jgi:hypothetical protein
MKSLVAASVAFAAITTIVSGADAGRRVTDLSSSSLSTYAGRNGQGAYYTVDASLPSGVTRVREAWLEVHVDASVDTLEGFSDPAPLFEVFMLNASTAGGVSRETFVATRHSMSRPVAVGSDRLVRIDVTEYAQTILADPSRNHGLVMGSVTGDRRGMFTIRSGTFGAGKPARITVME